MDACGNYEHFLQTIQPPGNPRIVTRPVHNTELIFTEVEGTAGFGATTRVGYDDAYVLQLRLRECHGCNYFLDGQPLLVEDRRAGALQFHDLRAAPSAEIHDAYHVLHLYLPRLALAMLAEEVSHKAFGGLNVQHGESYRDATTTNLMMAMRYCLTDRAANGLLIEHVSLTLCAHLVSQYARQAPPTTVYRGGLAAWQAKRVKDLIKEHISEEVSLTRLATECGLSVRHFSRAFAQTFGMPAHRFLIRKRVELALDLLKVRHLSIPEIALKCGFVDQSHLSRVFATHIGSSPGQWRRSQHDFR